jgi:membrane dipeptidase
MISNIKIFVMKRPLISTVIILFLVTGIFFLFKETVFSNKEENKPIKDSTQMTSQDSLETSADSIVETRTLTPEELHFDALLVDTHNDFVYQVSQRGAVFGRNNKNTHSDLPKFREGGLDVQVFSAWIPMSKIRRSYDFVLGQVDILKGFERANPDDIEFANSYEDIIRIVNEGKICGMIGVEGGTVVESDLDNINRLFEMGVRYIGLTWNNSNLIASSARDETERGIQGGLTEFGFEVIKRMDDVGMLIDVSHLGEASFWDVIETTKNPIIASHSNSYTIHPHYRNLTDEQIKAIAKGGGVIQVNFHRSFLGEASLQRVFEHIDYIKKLVGVDYIGIGSDFDGGIDTPSELADATMYPNLTKKLLSEGYTQEEVRKILGLNFLRVFKKVCG